MSLNTCRVMHFLRNAAIRLGGQEKPAAHLKAQKMPVRHLFSAGSPHAHLCIW
ncbi:hypothetical protein [Pseudomonas sp. Z18(2022)]|uniref:hypothetical protein n=1 Tax=Pseudomonas sp. Z18(2022) TaxID=2983410 RepID=UPI002E81BF08|nr:hypothetical protein [Pseudomonas sp. Z18(2022)]